MIERMAKCLAFQEWKRHPGTVLSNQSTPKSCIEFLLNSSLCACALKHQGEHRHMDLPSLTTGIGFRAATFDSGLLMESPYTINEDG